MLSLSLLGIHGLQKADLSRHRTMKNILLFLCVGGGGGGGNPSYIGLVKIFWGKKFQGADRV